MKLMALALILFIFNSLLAVNVYTVDETYKVKEVLVEESQIEEMIQEIQIEEINAKKDTTIDITFLGDICFGTDFGNKGSFHKIYLNKGSDYFFSGIVDKFKNQDLVVANLENVFTYNSQYQKGKIWTYKADPMYLDILKKSGITHFGVVNNHMGDYLQAGFDDSLIRLDSANLNWFGTNELKTSSPELGSIQVDKKEIYEKDDFKVGLIAYNGFYESYATDAMIKRDMEYFKDNNVDYIVALLHWGGQNTNNVTPRQKEYGYKLINMGVDLIIGGHPHALQEVEEYKGKRIYYSLGDFLFVHRAKPSNPDGIMVHLKLTKDKDDVVKEEFSHTPVLWAGSKNTNTFRPIISIEKADINRAYKLLKIKTESVTQTP